MKTIKKNFRVLYVLGDNWIVSKGYKLYKYNCASDSLSYIASINDTINSALANFKLTRRLFRAEISHLYHFKNDNWMCIGKKAIFKLNKSSKQFEKCYAIEKGSKPMNLCQSKDGTIYFGEYCYNPQKKEMRIFQTKDEGKTWTIAFVFKNGEINHIHGIFQDPYSNKIWVATGDVDAACIFGYTEDGFQTFIRMYEGSQLFRICVPMFTEKEIIYATDSQYEQNYIRSIDRETGKVKNLQAIQGSGICAVKCNHCFLVSTTVEPSTVNKDNFSHLWYSKDGHIWKEIFSYRKDILPRILFQFGTIMFPEYEGNNSHLIWNGRAISGLDGKCEITEVINIK